MGFNQTYLFDFDGTLVDSMPTFGAVMLRILDGYGIKYGDDLIKIITPLGYRGTAEYFKQMGAPAEPDELMRQMNEYATDAYENSIQAKPEVSETLRLLKKRGVSLNILTASPHAMLDPCLHRLGIFSLFDNVWSSDDFKTTKSNPKIYEMAAEKIGVPIGDIVFVDDNVGAIKTAKTAGMRVYGIYDKSSEDFAEEMKRTAERYIVSFSELAEL